MGWRGSMLNGGTVWLDSNHDKITAINKSSIVLERLTKQLITQEKFDLHPSLRKFSRPIYKVKTKNYLIRVDELVNKKYRYAAWKLTNKQSSLPDLVLSNGDFIWDGSGGNHSVDFVNTNYTYKIRRIVLGSVSSPKVLLEVYKDDKLVLQEDGRLLEVDGSYRFK